MLNAGILLNGNPGHDYFEKAITSRNGIVYRTSGIFTATRWFRGSPLSKARLHHAMSCAGKDLCFVLFEHFRIYVARVGGWLLATPLVLR